MNTFSNSKFKTLLEANKKYEHEAGRRIEILNNVKIISVCNNNKFDFETDDNIKYEVKADHLATKTNNFFIEFSGYGKPSGIETTEAQFYILTDIMNYFLIDVNELKELCEHCKKIVTTADKLTYGYLVSRFKIVQRSIII